MSQATPGPWMIRKTESKAIYVEDGKAERGAADVAFICPRTEREANARLIAAAPELLKALKRIRGVYDVDGRKLDVFEAAMGEDITELIASAEGRG